MQSQINVTGRQDTVTCLRACTLGAPPAARGVQERLQGKGHEKAREPHAAALRAPAAQVMQKSTGGIEPKYWETRGMAAKP